MDVSGGLVKKRRRGASGEHSALFGGHFVVGRVAGRLTVAKCQTLFGVSGQDAESLAVDFGPPQGHGPLAFRQSDGDGDDHEENRRRRRRAEHLTRRC